MLAAMRYLEPSYDICSTFQYLNLAYLVASMVAERVSGQSWTEFTRARLTDKVHMNVKFTAEDLAAIADAAVARWTGTPGCARGLPGGVPSRPEGGWMN
jgi:CubicO group peptidase (beta-lactamase class C family)